MQTKLLSYRYFWWFIRLNLILCCIIRVILLFFSLMFEIRKQGFISIDHRSCVFLMIIWYFFSLGRTYFIHCFVYCLGLNSVYFIEIGNEDFIDSFFSSLNLLYYWLIFGIRTILQFTHQLKKLALLKRLFFLRLKY